MRTAKLSLDDRNKIRAGVKHNQDMAPGRAPGRTGEWITGVKAKHFLNLFNYICKKKGISIKEGKAFVGLAESTVDALYKGQITTTQGKKILACYSKIAATQKAAPSITEGAQ